MIKEALKTDNNQFLYLKLNKINLKNKIDTPNNYAIGKSIIFIVC